MDKLKCAALVLTFALLPTLHANAIEAPAPPRPAAATAVISPADSQSLHSQLIRVAHRQRFRELRIEPAISDLLSRNEVAAAVSQLGVKADQNDAAANIALIRVQHWCSRLAPRERHRDAQMLEQMRAQLSADEQARLQSLLNLQLDYEAAASKACQQAPFDYRMIEARLREAADAGEPMSVTELSRLETKPQRVEELLQQAANKNYAPAQYALAVHRLTSVQRGISTENVASIRVLLKQSGRIWSQAKLDLANCMALGCEGHPADVAGAVVFGLDAARDGERGSYSSIARMPWAARLPFEQRLAWQYFAQQLNNAGCFGEHYLPMYRSLQENVAAYEKALSSELKEQAKKIAGQYWKEYGPRAQREQQCAL
jgi:hypothetical protein